MESRTLNDFATRYTAAWCSQHAVTVASFFEERGSLKINDGTPAVGRAAITNSVQSFITAFPDIVVKMDRLVVTGTKTEYHWTLTGTKTGRWYPDHANPSDVGIQSSDANRLSQEQRVPSGGYAAICVTGRSAVAKCQILESHILPHRSITSHNAYYVK